MKNHKVLVGLGALCALLASFLAPASANTLDLGEYTAVAACASGLGERSSNLFGLSQPVWDDSARDLGRDGLVGRFPGSFTAQDQVVVAANAAFGGLDRGLSVFGACGSFYGPGVCFGDVCNAGDKELIVDGDGYVVTPTLPTPVVVNPTPTVVVTPDVTPEATIAPTATPVTVPPTKLTPTPTAAPDKPALGFTG